MENKKLSKAREDQIVSNFEHHLRNIACAGNPKAISKAYKSILVIFNAYDLGLVDKPTLPLEIACNIEKIRSDTIENIVDEEERIKTLKALAETSIEAATWMQYTHLRSSESKEKIKNVLIEHTEDPIDSYYDTRFDLAKYLTVKYSGDKKIRPNLLTGHLDSSNIQFGKPIEEDKLYKKIIEYYEKTDHIVRYNYRTGVTAIKDNTYISSVITPLVEFDGLIESVLVSENTLACRNLSKEEIEKFKKITKQSLENLEHNKNMREMYKNK